MSTPFWRHVADGLELAVRATPKGGRDAIEGVRLDANGAAWLAVRISVPPDGGRANSAIAKLIAFQFGVRASDVTLVSGATARLKRLKIHGDSQQLCQIAAGMEKTICQQH